VDGRVASGGGTQHVVGVGDVPGHDVDTQIDQRTDVGTVPG